MLKNSLRLNRLYLLSTNLSNLNNKWHRSLIATEMCRHYQMIGGRTQQIRGKKDDANLSALFKPVPVKSNPDDISIGAELTGKLDKAELLKILNKFTQKRETKILCMENGLDSKCFGFLLLL